MNKINALLLLVVSTISACAQSQSVNTTSGEIVITPILHSTMVIEYKGITIYSDPYGGPDRFSKFPAPDIVFITHTHGDHLDKETLKGIDLSSAELIAPEAVINNIGEIKFEKITKLDNGAKYTVKNIKVEALPMYNLPVETARHKKGIGNGYVLEINNKRIYIAGDTEDIPEMRQLKNIDIAFIPMNLPYTMTVEQAADAVLEFQPKIVYPYHYRGKDGFSDVDKFKSLVNKGNKNIEVRLVNWYPKKKSEINNK